MSVNYGIITSIYWVGLAILVFFQVKMAIKLINNKGNKARVEASYSVGWYWGTWYLSAQCHKVQNVTLAFKLSNWMKCNEHIAVSIITIMSTKAQISIYQLWILSHIQQHIQQHILIVILQCVFTSGKLCVHLIKQSMKYLEEDSGKKLWLHPCHYC